MSKPPSLPALLRLQAERLSCHSALRSRRAVGWRDYTYVDYFRAAQQIAAHLIGLGVEPGERVGLLAANSPAWLFTDLGIQAAAAVTVPLHTSLPTRDLVEQLDAVDAKFVFVDRGFREPIPDRFTAIPLGCDEITMIDSGTELRRREEMLTRDHLATILFTSGTTGSPKGVMLTHGNLLSNAEAAQSILPWGRDGVMLNFLPFSHIYARTSDAFQALVAGATLALAESYEAMPNNLLEIRPDFVRGVPRFYEKMLALAGEPRQLPERFGGRVRWMFVGGAGLPERVAEQYQHAGLTLLQGYGLTETSPTMTVNRPDRYRIGSVGVPIPDCEVRIADDGEILTRGPHVMAGYWRDPATTAMVMHDGWFHTGDLGAIDADGFLMVTGRKKELIVLSTGRKVVPFRVESRLQAEPTIEHAIVCGDGQPYLVALIVPRGQLDTERIRAALSDLAPWEQVRRFAVLPRPLSMEQGELTLTQKVRREVVLAHFADVIADLYRG